MAVVRVYKTGTVIICRAVKIEPVVKFGVAGNSQLACFSAVLGLCLSKYSGAAKGGCE
ncbi:hypothetical protein MUGA111182_20110 [Mucilaginibacter galii]